MTQKSEILECLKQGMPVTPIDALKWFGCFRLAAVIHDLRKDGYEINCEMVQNGKKNQFGKYTLVR